MPLFSSTHGQRRGDIRKKRWTYSMVSAYQRCPRYFELNYIENFPMIYSSSLVEGIAHHDALDEDNFSKYELGKITKQKAHYELFADTFSDDKKHIKIWADNCNERKVLDRGKGLIKSYKTTLVSKLVPVEINKKPASEYFFEFPIKIKKKAYTIQGFMDLVAFVGQRFKLLDYKITKQAKPQNLINSSLQLTIYSIAVMKALTVNIQKITSGLVSMIHKSARVDVKTVIRNLDQVNWAMKNVKDTILAAEAGIYPTCSPEHFLCNPNYCGHWYRCRGKSTR